MIKLRVEYHHKCTGCGTELVVDFLSEPMSNQLCVWCGCECETDFGVDDTELKKYVMGAVRELEDQVNTRPAMTG